MDPEYRPTSPRTRRAAILAAAVLATLSIGSAFEPGHRGSKPRAFVLSTGEPVLALYQPAALRALETEGYSLGAVLERPGHQSAEAIAAVPAMRTILSTLEADLAALRAELAAGGQPTTVRPLPNRIRALDPAWLRSPFAAFRLAAVVNRLDRRDFETAGCGEIRFVYRLAYRVPAVGGWFGFGARGERASRLPILANVVFALPVSAACRASAAAFIPPRHLEGPAAVSWLLAGPLARSGLTLRKIEINAQIARIPSEMEPELGGQAIYLLRVFRVERRQGALIAVPAPLENTPDLARLSTDGTQREALLAFVSSNAAAVSTGVYRLPDAFLATKALSYSTFGSSRPANHPFTALFGDALAPAVRERLDAGTCMGCHQTNATAGFHVFGEDDDDAFPLNRVFLGASPHFYAEQPRRAAYVRDLAAGRPPRTFRPLPEAPAADWPVAGEPAPGLAGVGMTCRDEGAGPACADGLTCRTVMATADGRLRTSQCLPAEPLAAPGLPCRFGRLEPAPAAHRDRAATIRSLVLAASPVGRSALRCLPPRLGVPGGLLDRTCASRESPDGGTICAVGGGTAFDLCTQSGDFSACLAGSITLAERQACSPGRYCREDYICQTLPAELAGGAADAGFCTPTYFMFQVRVDGHPSP